MKETCKWETAVEESADQIRHERLLMQPPVENFFVKPAKTALAGFLFAAPATREHY
jgi:hypothetical protein